jgi:hypothetical protein
MARSGFVVCEDSSIAREDGECTVPAVTVKVEVNPKLSQGLKRKQTLEEVMGKIAALAPPAPPKDARFFYHVCGLTKDGRNPHSLSESRDAPGRALEAIFGVAKRRHVYSVKNAIDKAVVGLIHKLYPLCYSLVDLPKNSLEGNPL